MAEQNKTQMGDGADNYEAITAVCFRVNSG